MLGFIIFGFLAGLALAQRFGTQVGRATRERLIEAEVTTADTSSVARSRKEG